MGNIITVKTDQLPIITDLTDAKIIGLDKNGVDARFRLTDIKGDFKGTAIASTNPGSPALSQFYNALPGVTYTNFKDASNVPITIPLTDGGQTVTNPKLTSNGSYWVATWEKITLPVANNKIVPFVSGPWPTGSQVNFLGQVWEAQSDVIAGEIPGVSVKWKIILNDFLTQSANRLNRANIVAGWCDSTGTLSTSTNFIRSGKETCTAGESLSIQGFGNVSSSSPRIVFFNSSNAVVSSVLASGSVLTPITVVVPATATGYIVNIVNRSTPSPVGIDPYNATESTTIMVNTGSTALPYEPYGRIVGAGNLTGDIKTKQIADLTASVASSKSIDDKTTVMSYNEYDFAGTTAGNWSTAGVANTSVNWIKTPKIPTVPGAVKTISGFGTVSSSSARIVYFDVAGAFKSVVLAAGSDLTPITFTVPADCYFYAINIVNRPTPTPVGNDPVNAAEALTFMVRTGSDIKAFQPYGVLLNGLKIANLPTATSSLYDTREIVVVKTNDTTLNIYYHTGNDAANDVWFGTTFKHTVDLTNYVDTWRFDSGYICKRLSDTSFSNDLQIILAGVWENAIYTTGGGYPDALGSAHGFEQLIEASIMLDGRYLDVIAATAGTVYKCKRFFAVQISYLRLSTGNGQIARSYKRWDLTNGAITIGNTIKWNGALQILQNSYLSMCPVMRKNGAVQITNTGLSNDEWIKQDITNDLFTNNIGPGGDEYNPSRNTLIAFGDRVRAEMKVKKRFVKLASGTLLPYGFTDAGMYIQNTATPGYNKLYGRFGSTTTAYGDEWQVETEYIIAVK